MAVTTLPFRVSVRERLKVARDMLYQGDPPSKTYALVGGTLAIVVAVAFAGFLWPLALVGVWVAWLAHRELSLVYAIWKDEDSISTNEHSYGFMDEAIESEDDEGRKHSVKYEDYQFATIFPPNLVLYSIKVGDSFVPLRAFRSDADIQWVLDRFEKAGAIVIDRRKKR